MRAAETQISWCYTSHLFERKLAPQLHSAEVVIQSILHTLQVPPNHQSCPLSLSGFGSLSLFNISRSLIHLMATIALPLSHCHFTALVVHTAHSLAVAICSVGIQQTEVIYIAMGNPLSASQVMNTLQYIPCAPHRRRRCVTSTTRGGLLCDSDCKTYGKVINYLAILV